MSVHLSFYWSTPLVWCLGPHSYILCELSGKVSDLKLSKKCKGDVHFQNKTILLIQLSFCYLLAL